MLRAGRSQADQAASTPKSRMRESHDAGTV